MGSIFLLWVLSPWFWPNNSEAGHSQCLHFRDFVTRSKWLSFSSPVCHAGTSAFKPYLKDISSRKLPDWSASLSLPCHSFPKAVLLLSLNWPGFLPAQFQVPQLALKLSLHLPVVWLCLGSPRPSPMGWSASTPSSAPVLDLASR